MRTVLAGRTTEVQIAVADDDGRPAGRLSMAEVSAGNLSAPVATKRPGVWSATYTAPIEPGVVTFRIVVEELQLAVRRPLTVESPRKSDLNVGRRIDGSVGAKEILIPVRGEALPPADALQVAVGEGTVLGVETDEHGLVVRWQPGESKFPRYVPVLLRDGRGDARPISTGIRLRARPKIALQSEAGAQMVLTVGTREYGPFIAGDDGILRASLDQYPGELSASALITDPVGNEARTELALPASPAAALVGLATAEQVPGRPLPVIYLRGIHGDGHSWNGRAPTCRSGVLGEVPVEELERGSWVAYLPAAHLQAPVDLRVFCNIGSAAETKMRVPVATNYAASLRLKVYPEELSVDSPYAEIQAILEDAQGARLSAYGVQVRAKLGQVDMEQVDGAIARGSYTGTADVLKVGEDVITARFDRPPGTGAVADLEVTHGSVNTQGDVTVFARALNRDGRALADVDLALSAGEGSLFAVTDKEGWATAVVPLPPGEGPVVLSARTPLRTIRQVALRNSAALGGPGTPEFVERRVVRVATGRISSVSLTIDPPVLYLTQNSVAFVRVRMLDRYGNVITDLPVELKANEGVVGAPVLDAVSGTWVAEYTPAPGERTRAVRIEAVGLDGDANTVGQLLLAPRPVERSLMVTGGAISNLGKSLAGTGGIDAEFRTRWTGATMFRVGISTWSLDKDTNYLPPGESEPNPVTQNLVLFPLFAGAGGRLELPNANTTLWAGGGPVLQIKRMTANFDRRVTAAAKSRLGLVGYGGVGWRFGDIELGLEARTSFMQGVDDGEVSFTGQLGGLSVLSVVRIIL